MKTLERKYSKSERIIAKARFSAWAYAWVVVVAAVLGGIIAALWLFGAQIENVFTNAGGEAIYLTEQNLKYALAGAACLVVIMALVQAIVLNGKEFIVTEDKIVYREGVLSVKNVVVPLNEVRIVESKQNLIQRLLHIGAVTIISDAEQPYKIKGITAADKFARRIMRQVADAKAESDSKRMQLQLEGYTSTAYRRPW